MAEKIAGLEGILGLYEYNPKKPDEKLSKEAVKEILSLKRDSEYNSLFCRYPEFLDEDGKEITKRQLIILLCKSRFHKEKKLRGLLYFGFATLGEAERAVGEDDGDKYKPTTPETGKTLKETIVEEKTYDKSVKEIKSMPISKILESGGKIELEKAIEYLGDDFKHHKFSPVQELSNGVVLLKADNEAWILRLPTHICERVYRHGELIKGGDIIAVISKLRKYAKIIKKYLS